MTTKSFPECCGIIIITNFGNAVNAGVGNNIHYSEKEVDSYFTRTLPILKRNGYATAMIALSNDQQKIFKKVLKDHKFRCVSNHYHPNHDSRIFTYIRPLNNEK